MRWCAVTSRIGVRAICCEGSSMALPSEEKHHAVDGNIHDDNIVWHDHPVARLDRERLHRHQGAVIWFTGLSGSGKSTLAGQLEQRLHQLGVSTYLLDGDNVRHGLCRDLGFSDDDWRENILRVGEVACLMVDAGLVVLTAFISPHRAERQMVRESLPEGKFIEVFVDTPLAVCEARDPKGLYKKARAGTLTNFTGIDAVYEPPHAPDLRLEGEQLVTNLTDQLLDLLHSRAIIKV
ncbi:adenylyl-sulfate kinase [Candidatus Symbiopectobacterium sp. 'North America']|uniref:adenylyl-sulfate kinase n=1 Tax=Candidatus Symbiopectobacterium sp. 'North America' TaxID=2794574 RepID=UPI0018C96632|nr:adenylyl-sulfate kinase [Candidatus Symbiopectobacterium sp. 'North America']MBG6245727.1 adenylyl-sulfate kinase [Candidatus Symbiopectobacterium sp. 'North America']